MHKASMQESSELERVVAQSQGPYKVAENEAVSVARLGTNTP